MSYEDTEKIKEQLYAAYTKACIIVGEQTIFKPVQVVIFKSGKRKFSIKIDKVL